MTETIEARIKACIERHPDWGVDRIQRAIRGARRAVVEAVVSGTPLPEPSPEEKLKSGVISLNLVKQRYDIATAIREELAKLPSGTLILERELCLKTAGKDRARFKRTVDNTEEFDGNRIRLRMGDDCEGQWYWGSLSDISKAKKLRDA